VSTPVFERSELLSPELVLVDPELRRQLLAQPRRVASPTRDFSPPAIHSPQGLRLAAPIPRAPAPRAHAAPESRSSLKLSSLVIAATSVTAALALILTQTLSFHNDRPARGNDRPARGAATPPKSGVLTPPAQIVAVVPAYTPPAAPVKRLGPPDEHRLASLLRLPMRDPFARRPG
jgi:hypothetical protein